jgi:hypothetical protein
MRNLIRPALFALWTTALVAIAADLIVIFAGQAANGAEVGVAMQGQTVLINAVAVIATVIFAAVLAAVGALVIVRIFPKRGVLVFAILGAIVTLASLGAATTALTPTGSITLVFMHIITGTVVVVGNAVVHSRAKDRAAVSTR